MTGQNLDSQNTKELFLQLAEQWREETDYLSNANQIVSHPAYLKIIDMGFDVVPLILQEMLKEPGHWFAALKTITKVDPVPKDDRGKIQTMTAQWLAWGRENGYLD